MGSLGVTKWLALPTFDHKVMGLSPAGSKFQSQPKQHFVAQNPS